jgi:hypothetical protein
MSFKSFAFFVLAGFVGVMSARAQAPLPTPSSPPSYSPAELDRIVSPIALYPDPLLAQVLAAATYSADIPEAARWSDNHHYLTGSRLTAAMVADNVDWDPSVQALLPFPSVLEMMASDMAWTQELGDAFLADPDAVMDAVQRMRRRASDSGYLRSCSGMLVRTGPYVEIMPSDPGYITVPYYNPGVVFGPPGGFVTGAAIYCGFGIRLGAWFEPWGWGRTRVIWANHSFIFNDVPWGRRWGNRDTYVHPSPIRRLPGQPGQRPPGQRPPNQPSPGQRPPGQRPPAQQPPDQHKEQPRTPKEREREQPKDTAPRSGAPVGKAVPKDSGQKPK